MSGSLTYANEKDGALSLAAGEAEIYRTGVHWVVLLWPTVIATFVLLLGVPSLMGIFAPGGSPEGTGILAAITLFFLFNAAALIAVAVVKRNSSEVMITNHRITRTAGIFRLKSSHTYLDQVKKVTVRQGRLSKQLGYGTVAVHQFGGHALRLKKIPQPHQLVEFIRGQMNRPAKESAISLAD